MGQLAVAGTETKKAEADLRVLKFPIGLQQGADGRHTGSSAQENKRRVSDRCLQQLKALLHAAAGIRTAQKLQAEVKRQ